jgi:hypothetical protein
VQEIIEKRIKRVIFLEKTKKKSGIDKFSNALTIDFKNLPFSN